MSADESDPLDREVSLKAKADSSGIELTARSRLISALDYLFGALVQAPGSYVGGIVARAKLRQGARTDALKAHLERQRLDEDLKTAAAKIAGEAKLTIIEAETQQDVRARTAKILIGSPLGLGLTTAEQSQLVLEHWAKERVRGLDNQLTIAAETISILEMEQPPGPAPDDSPTTDEGDDRRDEELIEEDWLNLFGEYAAKASSEHIQALWAKILAGEVRRPGAFSLQTLRFVAELDKETASLFEKYLKRSVGPNIPRPETMSGEAFLDMLALQESGLINGGDSGVAVFYDTNDEGSVVVTSYSHCLKIVAKPRKRLQITSARLTRVGRELAAILPAPDGRESLLLAADLLKDDVDSITLGRVLKRKGAQVTWVPLETLKAPAKPTT